MCTAAHTAHKSRLCVSTFLLCFFLHGERLLSRFGMLDSPRCVVSAEPCPSQPVRKRPELFSHAFSADQYVRSSVEPWPHDQAGRTFMQHLLCRYLVSTKRSISLFVSGGEEEEHRKDCHWFILCSLAELDNTPHVCPPQQWLTYRIHLCAHNSYCNSLHTTVHDHRESPPGWCPALLLAPFILYISHSVPHQILAVSCFLYLHVPWYNWLKQGQQRSARPGALALSGAPFTWEINSPLSLSVTLCRLRSLIWNPSYRLAGRRQETRANNACLTRQASKILNAHQSVRQRLTDSYFHITHIFSDMARKVGRLL